MVVFWRFLSLGNVYCIWFSFVSIRAFHYQLDLLSPRSAPGLKSPRKLWWAKEITPELHVAGGLTERQLKYAIDGGFKSIISLFHESNPGTFGVEKLISTTGGKEIAENAGCQFESVLKENSDWTTLSALSEFSKTVSAITKPTLIYANQFEPAAFLTLLHLAKQSNEDKDQISNVNSIKLYKMAAVMGLDFTSEKAKQLITKITDEASVDNIPKPNVIPHNWTHYWLAHPVYKNWFTAGQIRRGHLKEIENAGFKSVINMRQGVKTGNTLSQESITLINIKDGGETYDQDYKPLRQTDEMLKTLIIDPSKEKTFISLTSTVNYERKNEGDYGDEIGYNEHEEWEDFKTSKLNYYHLAIDTDGTYSKDVFGQYKDKLLEIGKQGPVLVHCASGKRVAYIGVLAAALQYNRDFSWALQRINELGFKTNENKNKDVYDMYVAWLNSDHVNKNTEL